MGKKSRQKLERKLEGEGGERKRLIFKSDLEKIFLFVIQWGTYLVLFAPLIIIKSSFFPFVTPKTIFFNVIVEIILVIYLFLAISTPRYRPKLNPLTITIAIFLGVLILTSITGINVSRSFWSTHERMTGLFTFLHLFAFFVILTSVFKKREDWEKILGVSVIVGVLLSLYVLSGNELSTRGGGTIGNTSFMAAYLLFDIFFALIIFLSKRNLIWKILSGGSLLIMVPVLLTSSARGAIIAFLTGLFLLAMGYLIFSRKTVLRRLAYGVILVIIIFGVISFIFQPDFLTQRTDSFISQMTPRFTVWGIGWEAWQEKFLLGWGPENFNVAFTKYFDPCLFLAECGGEIWFDRVLPKANSTSARYQYPC